MDNTKLDDDNLPDYIRDTETARTIGEAMKLGQENFIMITIEFEDPEGEGLEKIPSHYFKLKLFTLDERYKSMVNNKWICNLAPVIGPDILAYYLDNFIHIIFNEMSSGHYLFESKGDVISAYIDALNREKKYGHHKKNFYTTAKLHAISDCNIQ